MKEKKKKKTSAVFTPIGEAPSHFESTFLNFADMDTPTHSRQQSLKVNELCRRMNLLCVRM